MSYNTDSKTGFDFNKYQNSSIYRNSFPHMFVDRNLRGDVTYDLGNGHLVTKNKNNDKVPYTWVK